MTSPKTTTQTAIRTIVDAIELQESAIAELTKRQENEEQINAALRTALETKEKELIKLQNNVRVLETQFNDSLDRGDSLDILISQQQRVISKQKSLIWSLAIGAAAFYLVSGLYFGIIVLPI